MLKASVKDLLALIGELTVENRLLKGEIEQLKHEQQKGAESKTPANPVK
jgi:hypothetical protein